MSEAPSTSETIAIAVAIILCILVELAGCAFDDGSAELNGYDEVDR
jgi:hypothetical protein